MKIGFIGTGKMATAIAKGIINRGLATTADVRGADIAEDARRTFADATGVKPCADPREIVEQADVIILAVKPQTARQAAESVAPLCNNKLIVSIAAGIPLKSLCQWFGSQRVVRVMPNTPATVGMGAAAYCVASGVIADDSRQIAELFRAVGTAIEVEEEQMDAVTALSGSGPAYIFEMIQAMTDAATSCGLPADAALELTVQTAAGAAAMLKAELGTPDQLRDAVTSPGGTTAAGLAVMETNRFRKIIADTIIAARDRSIELGRS